VLDAGPCPVVQVKTVASDGYAALQLGYSPQKAKRLSKPVVGHYKKAGVDTQHYLREVRLPTDPTEKVGDVLKADVFAVGEMVDVIGTSKGPRVSGRGHRVELQGQAPDARQHEPARPGLDRHALGAGAHAQGQEDGDALG
jgi:large subunit ribosomal protein L3